MIKDQNRKNEEKIKELQNFIQRFAANKSKSRQATSRRKLIDKLTVEEMPASSRRYPWVAFQQDREAGKDILEVRGISKTIDGEKVLDNVSFIVRRGDKIAFISDNELAMTTLFQILMGEMKPDEAASSGALPPRRAISRRTTTSSSRATRKTCSTGSHRIPARIRWNPRCAASSAVCCSPATMFTSRFAYCPAVRRFA